MLGADDPGQISRRHGGLIDFLEPLLDRRHSTLDHAQIAALERLSTLADDLVAFKAARKSALKRLFGVEVPRGVYLWGGVGRGKSLLMDSFYATVAIRRKTRVHFHAFMRDVHGSLAQKKAVRTGVEQKSRVEILAGVSTSDSIITSGAQFVKDQASVTIQQ